MGYYQLVIPGEKPEVYKELQDYLKGVEHLKDDHGNIICVNLPEIHELDQLKEIMVGVHPEINCYNTNPRCLSRTFPQAFSFK